MFLFGFPVKRRQKDGFSKTTKTKNTHMGLRDGAKLHVVDGLTHAPGHVSKLTKQREGMSKVYLDPQNSP